MRRYILPLIAALGLIGAMAYADQQGIDEIKWSQLPNMVVPARDWRSTNNANSNTLVADDWQCNSTGTIDDVHWWGSLVQGITQPDEFQLTVYADVPAVGSGFSQPSTGSLWQQAIDVGPLPGHVNVEFKQAMTYSDGHTEDVFQYYVDLTDLLGPDNRFHQTAGTIYWLSIQGLHTEPIGTLHAGDIWGWHEALSQNLDAAVRRATTTDPWAPAVRGTANVDMAFELSQVEPIPEPGTLALLALGLPGLLWWRRRR